MKVLLELLEPLRLLPKNFEMEEEVMDCLDLLRGEIG
jgi:hypothetical protein